MKNTKEKYWKLRKDKEKERKLKKNQEILIIKEESRGRVLRKSPGKSLEEDQFLRWVSSRKSPGKSPAEESREESREEARNNTKK